MIPLEGKVLDLFARLSRSASRSKVFAMRAKRDGRPQLAHLFRALAESQKMQARRFLMQARGTISTTDENEQTAFTSELPKSIEEYGELMNQAEKEGFRALATGFQHSGEVNSLLLDLYERLNEQEVGGDYYVCDFCGYVTNEKPPENCPICTAPKNRFQKVTTE